MADHILESYFVKVGALVDTGSFLKLGSVIKNTEASIMGITKGAMTAMATFELASLGTFSSIGAGLIGLADKAAMADQGYRLMGLRMLMTKDSARALQTTLHELGDVTLDQVAYDPELNKRFQEGYARNIELFKKLGPEYDKNMYQIRSMRVEYEHFGTEVEVLAYGTVSKLFTKLGLGSGDLLADLRKLSDWFTDNLPQFEDEISNDLIEPWHEAQLVFKDAWGDVKLFGKEFLNLISILSGDDSISNQEVSVRSLSRAFADLLDMITKVALGSSLLAKTGLHTASATMFGLAEAAASLRGDTSEERRLEGLRSEEASAAKMDFSDLWKSARARMTGGSFDGDPNNPDYAGFNEYAKNHGSSSDQYDMSDFGPGFDRNRLSGGSSRSTSLGRYMSLVQKYATMYGVDPAIIASIIQAESHGDPSLTSKKGAKGLMQLMDPTAMDLGVKNPFNAEQSIQGGTKYFSQLMAKYKDSNLAIAAYNAGPGAIDRYHGIPPYGETQSYVRDVQRMTDSIHKAQNGDVSINSLTINVPKNLPEDKWAAFVSDALRQQTDKDTKNTMAQTAGGAYF